MEQNNTSFFEINVRVNFGVLRDYLFGKAGLLRDAIVLGSSLLLCILSSGLQLALPSAIPELPLYPAVLATCHLYERGGRLSFAWPILCGLFIDSMQFRRPGCCSLVLLLCCALFSWIVGMRHRLRPLLVTAFASGAATFCWSLFMLIFYADGMDVYHRLALVPRELFAAPLFSILLAVVFNVAAIGSKRDSLK